MTAKGGIGTAGSSALRERLSSDLRPASPARGKHRLDELTAAAKERGSSEEISALLGEAAIAQFLATLMDDAPFLRRLILDDPGRLVRLLESDPDANLTRLCAKASAAWRGADEPTLMATLRHCRAEIALLVALADLGGAWDVERVTAAMSAFADAALTAATSLILALESRSGHISLPSPDEPQRGSGWIILAMGKYGAAELNYSSDLDLISLFDPSEVELPGESEPGRLYVRMTRALARILQDHTADGYVFRTDLRLRPDPGSTAVAVSTEAALIYYESQGQNWERAALIKAWPAAGDIAAGEAFLSRLTPFIWRKYLDYAAIADIHSIKRQIHDHRGHETIAVAGHNLKLGRGGIREIEFFVQTQQLIAGGRNPSLRRRGTLETLRELAAANWVEPGTAETLASAYRLLRRLEHRLQMVGDEQTHTLPADPGGLDAIARLAGLRNADALAKTLRPMLEAVQLHYGRLFESAPPLATKTGSLVFTGEDDDAETLVTLAELGFADPRAVSKTIRGWHHGRYSAMRSAAARERLTELTPALLRTLGAADNPDGTLLAFDRFLSHMPAGLQLFALIAANPRLLDLIALVLGTAPRLAEIVTRRPHVLDAVIEPAFFGTLPDRATLAGHLAQTLAQARSYEDALDRARIFGQEQAFLIGVRLLAGSIDARHAGAAYTDLADLLVGEALRLSMMSIAEAHGMIPGGEVAVIALGRLGGREMTAASDLDLILVYDVPNAGAASDGKQPLPPGPYYARLTQRLVAALSAPTAEGRLYEVDFRLRPSGNSGPLATGLGAFIEYQARAAETWERLALTRARVVAGDARLAARTEKAIGDILVAPAKEGSQIAADILEMRTLIEAEKGGGGPWDIKQAAGGLVDVEFITQYLQLLHMRHHPDLARVESEEALHAEAEVGVLAPGDAAILMPAVRLYQSLNQIIRLCVEEPFVPAEAPRGLRDLLCRVADAPDFTRLEAQLVETETKVRETFERLIGKVSPGRKRR